MLLLAKDKGEMKELDLEMNFLEHYHSKGLEQLRLNRYNGDRSEIIDRHQESYRETSSRNVRRPHERLSKARTKQAGHISKAQPRGTSAPNQK